MDPVVSLLLPGVLIGMDLVQAVAQLVLVGVVRCNDNIPNSINDLFEVRANGGLYPALCIVRCGLGCMP